MRFFAVFLVACIVFSPAYAVDSGESETSFITIENRSGKIAKLVAPGSKPVRVAPDAENFKLQLSVTDPNGIDAKAWWVSDPRQLCVIFVRYEGRVVIAGKKAIKCLGK